MKRGKIIILRFGRTIVWGLIVVLSGWLNIQVVAQTLPTGISVKMFYNTEDVTFLDRLDGEDIRTICTEEVPGYPQHFFVVDQRGRLFSLYPNMERDYAPGEIKEYKRELILDIRDKVHAQLWNEYGLYGVTFHKNFKENKKFYIMYITENDVWPTQGRQYSSQETGGDLKLEEWISNGPYSFNGPATQVEYSRLIFEMYHDTAFGTSNLEFNNVDGYLYFYPGDYRVPAWDLTTFGRKILRVDVDNPEGGMEYGIPPDNPYADNTDPDVKKEIWASGFRNLWRIQIDQVSGDIWAGDVGQWVNEELNYIKKGANYGWNNGGDSYDQLKGIPDSDALPKYGTGFSGYCNPYDPGTSSNNSQPDCSKFEDPYALHPHSPPGDRAQWRMNSVVSGVTFRGKKSSPFYGRHLYADTQNGRIWAAKLGEEAQLVGQSPASASDNGDGHDGIVDFNQDYFGNVYATYVSWGSRVHEIYMLDHEDLTPLTEWGCMDSNYMEFDSLAELNDPDKCVTLSVETIREKHSQNSGQLVNNIQGNREVEIPRWALGIELYDLQGKLVWRHSGARKDQARKVTIPGHVQKGILKVRALY